MKHLIVFSVLLFSVHSYGQTYWQQQVDYKIDVSLNDKEHSLKGFETLRYTNNSPDTLQYIWFHLWPNAYKNDQTAFALQLKQQKDASRLKAIKDKGFIDSLDFRSGGTKLTMQPHSEYIDVVQVNLASPLLPGASVELSTPFYVKLPTYNSRSGHNAQSYMICQWYPKPAVYDRKGWHPMPYLDQGEFYSEFGKFEVNVTVPSSYIVGATGVLHNQEELNQYKKIGAANLAAASGINKIKYAPLGEKKTLTYSASDVHDFAWFADKNYVIRYDTLLLDNKVVDVFSFHHPNGNKHWVNSTEYIKSSTRYYSERVGTYAYPVVQAVEGPKNDMSGGMEYPMITLITVPDADEENLDATITHEVGHNWFYGMLASNERQHPWMDEGLNTYYQFRYEAEKWRSNSVFGNQLPSELTRRNPEEFQYLVYNAFDRIPMTGAIETAAADFKDKEMYGLVVYVKTALWMYQLEKEYGKEKMDKALQAYFNEWKFKHPYPEDFRSVMERELGADISYYFDLLNKKGRL